MSHNDFTSIKTQLEDAMATLMPGAQVQHSGGSHEHGILQTTCWDINSQYKDIVATCDFGADTLQLNVHQYFPVFVPARATSADIVAAVRAARPRS